MIIVTSRTSSHRVERFRYETFANGSHMYIHVYDSHSLKYIEDEKFIQSFLSFICTKVGYQSALKFQLRVSKEINGEDVLI